MSNLLRLDIDSQLSVLVPLAERTLENTRRSRADNTRKAYAVQWAQFADWCTRYGLTSLPCAPSTLAMYLTERAEGDATKGTAGVKVATLVQTISAVNDAHKTAGFDPPGSALVVNRAMGGIKRSLGTAPKRKAPVLAAMLSRMIEVLPDTTLGARDRALLLVGFLGAFRRSELVAIEVSDLTFSDEGLAVLLPKSKTDQEKLGRTVGLARQLEQEVCPLRATKAWLERSGIAEGLVFRSVDRHGNLGKSLGDKDVARIVRRTAKAAGIAHQDLAGHSLRAGLATTAAKAGARASLIMKQTGHASVEMVARYIREAELFKDNVTTGMLSRSTHRDP